MKVALWNEMRNAYNTPLNLQFARVERTTNILITPLDTCKEVFANRLFLDRDISKRFRFVIMLTHWDGVKLDADRTGDFLNQAEQEIGISKSRVWDVTSSFQPRFPNTTAIAIDASSRWKKSSPMLHLLLLLARNGSGHDPKKNWKATLAKFRRTKAFREADMPQFLITRDAIPYIIERRGKLENPEPLMTNLGICQWTEKMKEKGFIK